MNHLPERLSSSLFLNPTTPNEVFNAIRSLKDTKSLEYDNVSFYFRRIAADVLATPLSYLYSSSFQLGFFPDSLKIARVLSIYKSGEKSEIGSYRPISILSSNSKLLKKLIFSRTVQLFFEKHSISLQTQYRFRANHSITHALLDVITSSFDNINNNNYPAFAFLDLKKAFDTANYDVILHKIIC